MTKRPPDPLLPGARARRATVAIFTMTFLYFTGFFPPSNNPNELSRIQSVVAFVDDGTPSIDRMLRKYGEHEDVSVYGGRSYSNKAPGLVFAALPVFRALRVFAGEPATGYAPLFAVLRLLTVSLVSLIALAKFARRLAGDPFRDERGLVTLAVALGTPFLFFARSFFSHAWTAGLLFLSWETGKTAEEEGSGRSLPMAAAGLLAGWALISEYTAAPIVLLLAVRVWLGGRFRSVVAFCLGLLPPLALLLAYNRACFGSPWSLSSAHEALPLYASSASHGLFGVGPPSARVIFEYLFSPSRGTILFSPFWLWALPGFVLWWKSRIARRDCAFAAAAAVLHVVILSGYPHWEGGYSLGSRYLIPALFFAALAIPFAIRAAWSRWLFTAAVAFSVAHFLLLTCSYPYIPPSVSWPAANVAWWSLVHYWAAPNIGRWIGLSPIWSLVPPALAVALALGLATVSRTGRPRARAAAILAGIGALALTIAFAPGISTSLAGWRAWLFQFLQT